MHLGHKITIALVFFISFLSYLAFRSFQENTDLVAEDYYQQEVEFQQKIDKQKNTQTLSENVRIVKTDELVEVRFPAEFESNKITGTILFFNPANAKLDITKTFDVEMNVLVFNTNEFEKGNYRVKLNWEAKGTKYYHEDLIVI